jgi:hypothetical protein
MYLLEMLFWKAKTSAPRATEELDRSPIQKACIGVESRIQREPADEYAIFSVSDRLMDVQGAWQEDRRGVVTCLFLGVMYVLQAQLLFEVVKPGMEVMVLGVDETGERIAWHDHVAILLHVLMWAGANFALFKYCLRWIRLEVFTQQRIIARFNRVTRQVHINRPSYAGGIITLPWDATVMEMTGGDPGSRTGDGTLVMGWQGDRTGAGFDEVCMLGGLLQDKGSAEALGEYIRRYMEEGPDAVPQPKRLRATFPWPWDSVRSTLSFLLPSWRTGDKGLVLTFALLLSPLLLLHSLCHWISLLLCWPTRWPRIIRRAGLTGAPLPALTVAEDYGPEIAQKLRASAMNLAQSSAEAESVSDA